MKAAPRDRRLAGNAPRPLSAAPSIGFISLGCAKNRVDSEIMAARLLAAGFRLAPAPERAGIVVVNTCAFIRDAKTESLDAIFEACSWKRKGACQAVLVAGCLPQRYRLELPPAMPEVDAWIGLDAIDRVAAVVRRLTSGGKAVVNIGAAARRVIEPPPDRPLFTGAPFAYLKIAEGCRHHCRFCVIPRIRGRLRSRSTRSIVAEAAGLLERGVKELNLIAQDVTSYGRDREDGAGLPGLLRALGALGGRFWIRLLYAHPALVTAELLETMGAVPQVCRYLDIPIQHSHPAVLAAMGRPAVPGGLARLLQRIRRILPDVVLRTTCLVGFPGETRAQFRHLLAFAAAARFEHLGVFAYSREEGTPAAALPGQVPAGLARDRRDRLMRLQQAIAFRRAAARVGAADEILIERPGASQHNAWSGRSRSEAPEADGSVFVRGPPGLAPGRFVTARYVSAAGYDLRAVVEGSLRQGVPVRTCRGEAL